LVDGVTFNGTFAVSINESWAAVDEQVVLDNETLSLDLPAGPYLRVDAKPVVFGILGQSLSGNFSFEQVSSATNPGTKITRIAAREVELRLGDGQADFVTLTEGTGSFVLRDYVDPVTSTTKTGWPVN
jgi:hypothetical protein